MVDDPWLRRLDIAEVLARYDHLRLLPSRDGAVNLRGPIEFNASAKGCASVSDCYEISISVPKAYPSELPVVYETNSRIPPGFHKLQGNALCLGAPLRLWLVVRRNPSLLNFIERVVIPYLYGYSLFEQKGHMPFGELEHGTQGLIDDLAEMLGAPNTHTTKAYIQAMRSKKRVANKRPCPCGSGLRLGRCHNRQVNHLRKAIVGYTRK